MHQVVVALVALSASASISAAPQDPRPAYEVASVKLNNSGGGHSGTDGSKGQIMFTNLTLERLIERAYDVKPSQVAGPDWLENLRFDIVAKYPPATTAAARPLMLRTLLEDRFKLAVHRETRDFPGYAMVVGKSGFKLKPVDPGGSSTNSNGRGRVNDFTGTKVSMDQLAAYVARELDQVVIDQTGIAGVYDFELHWTREDQTPAGDGNSPPNPLPTLPLALQDVLGVRLQPRKVPVQVIVVDHIERTPIAN